MKPGTYKFFDDFHPETGQGRIVAKINCQPAILSH
jgi:hypothetical protein